MAGLGCVFDPEGDADPYGGVPANAWCASGGSSLGPTAGEHGTGHHGVAGPAVAAITAGYRARGWTLSPQRPRRDPPRG